MDGIDPKKILLYGVSLGSGPTFHLASKFEVGGVIIQAGFMSICRLFSSYMGCRGHCVCLPGCQTCCDMFNNYSRIRGVRAPVLLMHSDGDETVQAGAYMGMRARVSVRF